MAPREVSSKLKGISLRQGELIDYLLYPPAMPLSSSNVDSKRTFGLFGMVLYQCVWKERNLAIHEKKKKNKRGSIIEFARLNSASDAEYMASSTCILIADELLERGTECSISLGLDPPAQDQAICIFTNTAWVEGEVCIAGTATWEDKRILSWYQQCLTHSPLQAELQAMVTVAHIARSRVWDSIQLFSDSPLAVDFVNGRHGPSWDCLNSLSVFFFFFLSPLILITGLVSGFARTANTYAHDLFQRGEKDLEHMICAFWRG